MSRRVWMVLLAGGLLMFIALGLRQGFGLFLNPVSQEMGWGREVFALSMALQNLLWGLSQPFAGALADKYGPARVLAVGGVLYTIGLLLMATTTSALQLHAGLGLFVGVALSGPSFAIVLGAAGRAVDEKHRSKALGIVSAIGSAGQFAVVPFTQGLLDGVGWQTTVLIMAAVAALMVPLAAGFAGTGQTKVQEPAQTLGAALNEAGRHSGFLYLTAGFFVCGFHVTFIMTHLPAYIVDNGLAGWLAAVSLSLVGFFNIVGTYVAGALGGRYRKKYLLSMIYLLRAAVIALFIMLPLTDISVMVFASAMGLLWLSTVPLTSGLVGQIFGIRYMSMLFGVAFMSHQVGAFLGAWLGGLAYDLTGSYDLVWMLGIALGVVAAVLHWPIADQPVARLRAAAPA